MEAVVLAEFDKELRQDRIDAAQRPVQRVRVGDTTEERYNGYNDETAAGYTYFVGWVVGVIGLWRLAGATVAAVCIYFDHSQYRAVELSPEQKDELRALIVNLELPDIKEKKPFVPTWQKAIPGYRPAFGRDGNILEGGSDVNFPVQRRGSNSRCRQHSRACLSPA